jgi:type II secretory pathway component PulJ
MAGRKLKIKARISGSTILEVVIAMVIIIMVFGIAMMIYANVMRMSLSTKKIKAQAVLRETLLQIEQTKDYNAQALTTDDFRIESEIKPYLEDTLLNEVHLTAYDLNQQKIMELQKVIIK